MQTLDNAVGNQEDWANYLTNVEMLETPVMDWLPVGSKPVNPEFKYQADRWRDPRQNAHVDGKPWTDFKTAGENRAELRSYIQWFDNTFAVSKLAQDVANNAAIEDEMAAELPKALKEMGLDCEAAICDNNESQVDNKVQGYKFRSIFKWIQATAQTHEPVDSDFRPPAASINSTAWGSQTEDLVRDCIASIGRTTKSKEMIDAFVGESLKRKFADFQLFTPGSTNTGATGVVFQQDGMGREIVRSVDLYNTDQGPMRLHLTYWLMALTGGANDPARYGALLHRSKWELRWNQKPKVYKPEFKGGSYECAMDMLLMLVCKNPKGEGAIKPA